MTRQRIAIAVTLGGFASFGVLLAGVAMFSVPLALILVGAAGCGLSAFALLYDPERRTP